MQDQQVVYNSGQPGSDRLLYRGLLTAEKNSSERRWDRQPLHLAVDTSGQRQISKADWDASQGDAEQLGVDGQMLKVNGHNISENQYSREQRANGGAAEQYPIYQTVLDQRRREGNG